MKNNYKRLISLTLFLVAFACYGLSVYGQTPATATWTLTTNGSPATSGAISATDIISYGIGTISHDADYGAVANNFSNSPTIDFGTFFEYSVTPDAGNSLLISSVSFEHGIGPLWGVDNIPGALYYLLDGSETQIGSDFLVPKASPPSDYGPGEFDESENIYVPDGQTITFRFHAWNVHIDDLEKNVINRNFVVSGETCAQPEIVSASATSTEICYGESTTLSVTGTLGDADNWYWYENGCGSIPSMPEKVIYSPIDMGPSIVVTPTTTTTYYVRAEGGCPEPTDCVSVTVSVNWPSEYRTVQAGSWDDVNTWEQWDGTQWVTPAQVPPSHPGLCPPLEVTLNHQVDFTGDLTVDNLIINLPTEDPNPPAKNLEVWNTMVLGGNLTVLNQLTLINGYVITGEYTLYVANDDPTSVVGGSEATYVIGNLAREIGNLFFPNSYYFPLGTNPYTPVEVTFNSLASSGTLVGTVTSTDHPDIENSGLSAGRSVNRFWSLDFLGFIAGNYDAKFNWVTGDEDAFFDYNVAQVGKFDGIDWTLLTTTSTSSSATIVNQSSFSDFIVANECEDLEETDIVCPADIVVTADPGACNDLVVWDRPVDLDAFCPITSTVTTDPDVGPILEGLTEDSQTFPVGVTTVTYTYDNGTDVWTCQFTVTVHAEELPEAVVAEDPVTLYLNDIGIATLTVAEVDGGSTISCLGSGDILDYLSLSQELFTCVDLGDNTETLTVTDKSGQVDTQDFTVIVLDIIPPTIVTCPLEFVVDNDLGLCTYTVAGDEFDIYAEDNDTCTPIVYEYTLAGAVDDVVATTLAGYVFPVGVTGVTATATDGSGNTSTCTYTITVEDNEEPFIWCIGSTAPQVANPGVCTYTWNGPDHWGMRYNQPDYLTDNCGIVTLSYSLSGATVLEDGGNSVTGQVFNVGITTITWTAIDAAGNSFTCSSIITINDNQLPVVTCPVVEDFYPTDPDECTATLTFEATATDNCEVNTSTWVYEVEGSPISFPYAFPIGSTTVTVTVDDIYGNTSLPCSFVVVVEDKQAPLIDCPSDITEDALASQCSKEVIWRFPIAEDNCMGILDLPDFEDQYTIVTDPPVAIQTYFDGNLAYWANSGDFPVGVTEVTYYVEDIYGNVASCTMTVTINPFGPPIADAVDDPIYVVLDENGQGSITNEDADENSSIPCLDPAEDILDYITLSQYDFDCSHVGTHTLVLTVTDKAGNIATDTFVVIVQDLENPVVATNSFDVYLDPVTGQASITPQQVFNEAGSSDNCGIDTSTLQLDLFEFDCSHVGDVVVTLSLEDVNGNPGSATATITVIDNTPPDLATNDADADLDENGVATITWADIFDEGNSFDACGIDTSTLAVDPDEFDCSQVGQQIVVTLSGMDVNGNPATATATVTVRDLIEPVWDICLEGDNQLVETNVDCTYVHEGTGWDAVASDNCDLVSPTATVSGPNSGNGLTTLDGFVFGLGTSQVTWTVTDLGGNTITCTFDVEVEDKTPPVIAGCPSFLVPIPATDGDCAQTVSWIPPTVTDNCSDPDDILVDISTDNPTVFLNTLGSPHFASFPLGTTTIYYVFTDEASNVATCSFTVTILDDVDPVARTQDIDVYLDSDGTVTIVATDVDGLEDLNQHSTDNCKIVLYELDRYTFTCDDLGENTVYLTVTDASGNTDTEPATVTVYDNIPPVAIAQDVTIELDASGMASVTPAQVDDGSYDNCDIVSMTLSWTDFTCADIGDHVVTLTVYDQGGLSDTATATITVEDNIEPVLANCEDRAVYADEDVCTYTVEGTAWDATATDNCDISSPTYTLSGETSGSGTSLDGVEFAVGVTTVTWSVTDAGGNTVTCVHTVIVTDNQPPVVTCPVVDEYYDTDPGLCQATLSFMATAEDNCGIETITYYIDATPITFPNVFPVGTTTVTVVATDVNGLTDQCEFGVVVVDTEAPTLADGSVCPEDQEFSQSACEATKYLEWVPPLFTDNCDIDLGPTDRTTYLSNVQIITETTGTSQVDVQTLAHPTYHAASFPVGVTSVHYVVTDTEGNQYTCTFTVTIDGGPDPIAGAKDEITVQLDEFGFASIVPEDVEEGSIVQCDILYMTVEPNTFDCSDVGIPVTVTLTVYDRSMRSSTATTVVHVEDNVPPALDVVASWEVVLDDDGLGSIDVDDLVLDASDACGILSPTLSIYDVDCSHVGDLTVTVTVEDVNGNKTEKTVVVTVKDETKPVLVTKDTTKSLIGSSVTIVWSDVVESATDACGIETYTLSRSEFDCSDVGAPITITVTVSDVNGNETTDEAVVTIVDDTPPTIACVTNTLRSTDPEVCNYTTVGAEFNPEFDDNCPGAYIQHDYALAPHTSTLADAVFEKGPTVVVWTVTDASGHTATCSITVVVEDNEDPVIHDGPAPIVDNNLPGECSNDVQWTAPTASDNCEVESFTVDTYPADVLLQPGLETGSIVGTFPVGVTTVTYTAIDTSGNTTTHSFTVTIIDNELPLLSECPQDLVFENDPGDCGAEVTWVSPEASDNCPGVSLSSSPYEPGYYNAGVYTVTYTAKDGAGNIATCSFTITVIDTEPPVLVDMPTDMAVDNDEGECGAVVSWTAPTATDNCDDPLVTQVAGLPSGDLFPVGVTTVTYAASDTWGNVVTESFTVTVTDTEKPVFTECFAGTEVSVDEGECSYSHEGTGWDAVATDNCGVESLTYTLTGVTTGTGTSLQGVVFMPGLTTVTWTATDEEGNYETCVYTIMVVEDEDPEISCGGDQIVEVNTENCDYLHAGTGWDATATDNCSVVTPTFTLSGATVNDVPATTLHNVLFNTGVTTVTWTVTDDSGNSDACSYTVTVNQVQLAGNISYYNYFGADVPMAGATVQLLDAGDAVLATTNADVNGDYLFDFNVEGVASGDIAKVQVSTAIPFGGLSATDALAVWLVANGDGDQVAYWTPESFLNNVGNVDDDAFGIVPGINILDVTKIMDRLLYPLNPDFYFRDALNNVRNWTFYAPDMDMNFSYVAENAATFEYDLSYCELNIIARPYGDVLGNYSLPGAKSLASMQSAEVMAVEPNQEFNLPVTLENNLDFSAMTLVFDYDVNKIEILDIKSDLPGLRYVIENGKIRVAWADLNPVYKYEGDALITLVARTTATVNHSDLVFNLAPETSFGDRYAQPIDAFDVSVSSVDNTGTVVGIDDAPDARIVTLNAYPNPFRNELTISYAIPESGAVRISIVNMLGAEVTRLVDNQHDAGSFNHTFNAEAEGLEYGMYFVRFDMMGETIQTHRLIKLIYIR